MRSLLEPDLLVLDDLFLARRIADASAELLQSVVHQRYKRRRSIVVTSNRVVQDWGKYLDDNTMSGTILDRLMHRSVLLEFEVANGGNCSEFRLKWGNTRCDKVRIYKVLKT
jgi:DNA replication protein DnaC